MPTDHDIATVYFLNNRLRLQFNNGRHVLIDFDHVPARVIYDSAMPGGRPVLELQDDGQPAVRADDIVNHDDFRAWPVYLDIDDGTTPRVLP